MLLVPMVSPEDENTADYPYQTTDDEEWAPNRHRSPTRAEDVVGPQDYQRDDARRHEDHSQYEVEEPSPAVRFATHRTMLSLRPTPHQSRPAGRILLRQPLISHRAEVAINAWCPLADRHRTVPIACCRVGGGKVLDMVFSRGYAGRAGAVMIALAAVGAVGSVVLLAQLLLRGDAERNALILAVVQVVGFAFVGVAMFVERRRQRRARD